MARFTEEIQNLERMLGDATFTRSIPTAQYRALTKKLRDLKRLNQVDVEEPSEPAPLETRPIEPGAVTPPETFERPPGWKPRGRRGFDVPPDPWEKIDKTTIATPGGGTATMPVDTYFDIQERERAAGVAASAQRARGMDAFSKYLGSTARGAAEIEEAARARKRVTSTISRQGRAAFAFDPGSAVNPRGSYGRHGMGLGPVVSSGAMVKGRRQAEKESLLKAERERLGVVETPEQEQQRQLGERETQYQQQRAWKEEERGRQKQEFMTNIESAMELADTVQLPEGSPACRRSRIGFQKVHNGCRISRARGRHRRILKRA